MAASGNHTILMFSKLLEGYWGASPGTDTTIRQNFSKGSSE